MTKTNLIIASDNVNATAISLGRILDLFGLSKHFVISVRDFSGDTEGNIGKKVFFDRISKLPENIANAWCIGIKSSEDFLSFDIDMETSQDMTPIE